MSSTEATSSNIDPYHEVYLIKRSIKRIKRYGSVMPDLENIPGKMEASATDLTIPSINDEAKMKDVLNEVRAKAPPDLTGSELDLYVMEAVFWQLDMGYNYDVLERRLEKMCQDCKLLCRHNFSQERMMEKFGLPDYRLKYHEAIYSGSEQVRKDNRGIRKGTGAMFIDGSIIHVVDLIGIKGHDAEQWKQRIQETWVRGRASATALKCFSSIFARIRELDDCGMAGESGSGSE